MTTHSDPLPRSRRSLAVSVIVCTRDRTESCELTVSRLLELASAASEIIVVDQSRDDSTEEMVRNLAHGSCLRYLRSERRGLSAARNEGAAAAGGQLLLFTDDDCIPDAEWIDAWSDSTAFDDGAGIGFGQVSCPPFDPAKGYTAGFNTREGAHGFELFKLGAGHVGMGANMAVPKSVWSTLGGFDEGLGAGTRFPASEDADLAYRAVKAGYPIHHVGAARVWHYGYRPGSSASRLMRGYVAGIAAMYAKHARCGDMYAVQLLALETWSHATDVTQRVLHHTRPLGLVGFVYFLRGIASAWRSPIDTDRRLYSSKDVVHAA